MRIISVFLVLAAIIGGIMFLTNTQYIAAEGVQPGDALYGLDRWMERVKSRFANTDAAQAENALENASERLSELTMSTEANDTNGIAVAAEGLRESLTKAVERAYNIAEPTARAAITEATERLTREAAPILKDVSARAEEATQQALASALETMQKELDAVFDRIKERAKEEIREEIAELGQRLKEKLQEQFKAIRDNITGESSE